MSVTCISRAFLFPPVRYAPDPSTLLAPTSARQPSFARRTLNRHAALYGERMACLFHTRFPRLGSGSRLYRYRPAT